MCLQCHRGIRPESIEHQWRSALENTQLNFERYNSTSISHLMISLAGADGPVARGLARQLLEEFFAWYAFNKEDGYLPSRGLEPMPTKAELRARIEELKNSPPVNLREST